jgi:hypothetical protein
MSWLATALVAGLLTVFDIESTFRQIPRKFRRPTLAWSGAFLFINVSLAEITLYLVRGYPPFAEWNSLVTGLAVGGGYLAIIRSKFASFDLDGKDTPLGMDFFYQSAKDFLYRRINSLVSRGKTSDSCEYAYRKSLQELLDEARMNMANDKLYTDVDKAEISHWLSDVVTDSSGEETQKKYIANFILWRERPDVKGSF